MLTNTETAAEWVKVLTDEAMATRGWVEKEKASMNIARLALNQARLMEALAFLIEAGGLSSGQSLFDSVFGKR